MTATRDSAQNQYYSKSEVVTSRLREMIITGEFPPGTPLRQRDLAKRFGVSATPAREALRRLEAEGLVRYDVHRGATVIDTDYPLHEENFQIRALLEGLAAGLAAERVTPEDLVAVEQISDELAGRSADDPAVHELNEAFHFRIYEAARSPLLMALLRLLWHSFPQGPPVSRPLRESVAQHAEILDALRAHDRERAEALIRRHILEAPRVKPRSARRSALAARRAQAAPVGAGN